MKDIRSILKISICDMVHEFWPSFLAVLGLAGILTPLLILFSLKYGIIASMSDRLLASPTYREIKTEKHQNLDRNWFENMSKRPEVEFIIPHIYFLNKFSVPLSNPVDMGSQTVYVDMNPTAPGDPVLERWGLAVQQHDEAVLSFYAAEKLNLVDTLTQKLLPEVLSGSTRIRLRIRNAKQIEEPLIKVIGILPKIESSKNNNQIFVDLTFLTALNDFRNKPDLGMPVNSLLQRDIKNHIYPDFRLYANSLKDVATLVKQLEAQDIPVTSKFDRIQEMQQIDSVLILVFIVVSGIGALGFLLATTVNLMANVARKQRDLSILRLMGYSSYAIAVFPAIQAVVTALTGSLLAWGLYYLAAPVIETQFNDNIRSLFGYRITLEEGANLMQLFPVHFFIAMTLTILVSIIASIAAGVRAANLMPAEGIRYD